MNQEEQPVGETNEVSFSGLILMLGTTGLIHLGATPDPGGGEAKVDLAQAKHVIELLEVLKLKTAGNLTAEESSMLDDLLFDLRMRYVNAVQRA